MRTDFMKIDWIFQNYANSQILWKIKISFVLNWKYVPVLYNFTDPRSSNSLRNIFFLILTVTVSPIIHLNLVEWKGKQIAKDQNEQSIKVFSLILVAPPPLAKKTHLFCCREFDGGAILFGLNWALFSDLHPTIRRSTINSTPTTWPYLRKEN
jgi:hypothetical protein